ncbi:hypothetical protein AX14_011023 [Amanita brunnescens Koide BX004]|nr:hypothetical protein AX14_011023 [Amanita brunnescens Koide BX004]
MTIEGITAVPLPGPRSRTENARGASSADSAVGIWKGRIGGKRDPRDSTSARGRFAERFQDGGSTRRTSRVSVTTLGESSTRRQALSAEWLPVHLQCSRFSRLEMMDMCLSTGGASWGRKHSRSRLSSEFSAASVILCPAY